MSRVLQNNFTIQLQPYNCVSTHARHELRYCYSRPAYGMVREAGTHVVWMDGNDRRRLRVDSAITRTAMTVYLISCKAGVRG